MTGTKDFDTLAKNQRGKPGNIHMRRHEFVALTNFIEASVNLLGPFKKDDAVLFSKTPRENIEAWIDALLPMLQDFSSNDLQTLPMEMAMRINRMLRIPGKDRFLIKTDNIEIPSYGTLEIEYFYDGTVIIIPGDGSTPLEGQSLQECLDKLFGEK